MTLVLLGAPGASTNILYHALAQNFAVARVILEEPRRRALLAHRARSLGLGRLAGQLLFLGIVRPLLHLISRARTAEIMRLFALDDSPIDDAMVMRVRSVNAPSVVEELRRLAATVVVVNGTGLLAPGVLEATRAPFINLHTGITPLYRGVHGGYWALAVGDAPNFGVTVHVIDRGIDTGAILYQERIRPTARDTFTTYPLLQLAAGLPLLHAAIRDAARADLHAAVPPQGRSRLWTHPTLWEYVWFRVTRGVT